jgi:hypothetical protein
MSLFNASYEYKNENELFDLIRSGVVDIDMKALYDQVRYQGFNRIDFLKFALRSVSPATMIKIAMIGAVRGSNFAKILETPNLPVDVKNLMDNGTILNRKATRTSDITITRCTAAMPEWSAYALMQAGVPGRLSKLDLDPCLQFPAAGSLPMSLKVRKDHIEFSAQFSRLINGSFKATIYKAMYNDTVKVANIHPDLLPKLGVTRDADAVVDIDRLLEEYVDDDIMASEDEIAVKGQKKRKRERY